MDFTTIKFILLTFLFHTVYSSSGTSLPIKLQPINYTENVILIIADDLGIDFLKDYGLREDTIPLPIIESMIQEGLLFENAYSYPSCSPARATLLTGRYGFRTGVRSQLILNL